MIDRPSGFELLQDGESFLGLLGCSTLSTQLWDKSFLSHSMTKVTPGLRHDHTQFFELSFPQHGKCELLGRTQPTQDVSQTVGLADRRPLDLQHHIVPDDEGGVTYLGHWTYASGCRG
jgi:hypothetical protein